MDFKVLIEDKSGSVVVDVLLGKILGMNGEKHTWRLHPYRGGGRIPKDLHQEIDPKKRTLLDHLPKRLRAYGESLDASSAVVVVVDLDNRDCMAFKRELLAVLDACDPRPTTLFRIAIEEIEAWLLGDRDAVKAAYPCAKDEVLDAYEQDAICGTWEVLADAVHAGGAKALPRNPGKAKHQWARRIAPCIDPDRNRSPSFRTFRDGVRRLADAQG